MRNNMRLFYTPDITLPFHTLTEDESRHAVQVLRLKEGDTLGLTDGKGNMYSGVIDGADKKRCVVRITGVEKEFEKRDYRLVMGVAPTKNPDRYEWFLEKATEVGCDEFIPLLTGRSERKNIKEERLQKVVTSAVKQSLKAYHPVLKSLESFKEVVTGQFPGKKLIAHCDTGFARSLLKDAVGRSEDVLVLIGPEGDFSPEEIKLALENGFKSVSLGGSRLRTETAALTAVITVALANQ